jgi:hypothetical protein
MENTYSEQELISFGLYLLSEEREKLLEEHPEFSTDSLEVRKRRVHDADLSNWKKNN